MRLVVVVCGISLFIVAAIAVPGLLQAGEATSGYSLLRIDAKIISQIG
jgi:hypothetical protein